MKRLVVAVVLLLAGTARAQTRGAVDWIFLVDTSQSMRGVGGTRNIFGDVKSAIGTFVNEASVGDSVTLYSFAREVELRGSVDIRGPVDRDRLHDLIRALRANGKRTYLGGAIAKGLDASEQSMRRKDPTRERAIVLFTDGKEDVRGIPDPITIASNIQRVATSKPYVFFVSLGEHEQQLDAFASERTKILKPHDIAEAVSSIRQTVQPPPKPPPPPPKVVQKLPEPPPVAKSSSSWKWLAALTVLLLLASIALVLYSGKSPGELLAAITERNTLEGELEIVAPPVGADAAYVGLPRLKIKDVALSAIVPPDALGGSDARLFCRRRNGEKKIWIAAGSGTLRVNDIEVPETQLYDADTIRIGDATLRFNRLGHKRPSLQEDPA
ncbi:MAG TPA: VWA domain-containing protein [Thermoanaerobaculia bacterium]|jgi:hypothetical protein|nr:VWA domain-containing protein [Thermoanaerobaculia bacterium]